MGFQPEYGLMGAGAVNASLIARLPRGNGALGPVAGVSFRVASRIANSLGAGLPARSAAALDGVRVILFHSSPDQFEPLLEALGAVNLCWRGKSLIFCDCQPGADVSEHFRTHGASVACLRRSALPGRLVAEGCGAALAFAHRLAKDLGMKAIEIDPSSEAAYETATMLGSSVLTPLIDEACNLLRQCGVRDTEAPRLAAALFEQTARDYARTGRQSWAWYQRPPDAARVIAHVGAAGARLRLMLREMILFGMDEFGRHGAAARVIREALQAEKEDQ